MTQTKRNVLTLIAAPCLAAAGLTAGTAAAISPISPAVARATSTATPVKHLVVIFDENVSFDHYFATYPHAKNPAGEPTFIAKPGTPSVNGLNHHLRTHNPNAANPVRLDRSHAVTCDQDHDYLPEQKADDRGRMDKFVENTDSGDCTAKNPGEYYRKGLVMDYYDGNTVTALWNYAQHFALSDRSFGTTYGPSTPGALNLVSGQTHGVTSIDPKTGKRTAKPDTYTVVDPNSHGVGTVINDPDPAYDDCSDPAYAQASMSGKNIGNLLNAKGVTWGWFEGGFRPTSRSGGTASCGAQHAAINGVKTSDYIPHHEPFEYYKSTSNPHHLAPSKTSMIGKSDRANHQYDLSDFFTALHAGVMPSVSYLKPAGYQDGHAGYSDPIDEQHFLVKTINTIQRSRFWASTAIVIAWDDSDGWYDHVEGPIVNQSDTSNDALSGHDKCGRAGLRQLGGFKDRCGYGPRLPLLVISPYAKRNFVDNRVTDQSSVLRFIEDNWKTGRLGGGSFDAIAGNLDGMLDFASPHPAKVILKPNGEVK
ncbi:MAG TPA: alkaline phosphatase family protein [Mycobacteriales bacterium]|nr:alkaline phosphatase family protein [Mycobacteriales bacterium]